MDDVFVISSEGIKKAERTNWDGSPVIDVETRPAEKPAVSPLPLCSVFVKPDWKAVIDAELAKYQPVHLEMSHVSREIDLARASFLRDDSLWERTVSDALKARETLQGDIDEVRAISEKIEELKKLQEDAENRINSKRQVISTENLALRSLIFSFSKTIWSIKTFLEKNC